MAKNNPSLPPLPGDGPDRGAARREAAQQAYRDQQRKARLRRLLTQVGIGVVVIAVALGITLVALTRGEDDGGSDTATDGGSGVPAQVDADGGFHTGSKNAKVTLTAVEDFQCPVCREFESVSGDLLA